MIEQPNLFDPVEYAKQCIKEEVDKLLPKEILFATIDLKLLAKITNHSAGYLKQHFIVIPEAKALECSPTTKRLWKYPDIRECWLDYCDRNNVRQKDSSIE